VRTEALSYLKKLSQSVEERVKVGAVTISDVAAARASALKAEIMLEALKAAAE
jgi:outer membrane protein TolC